MAGHCKHFYSIFHLNDVEGSQLFQGDSANPYIDGIGVHWYWDDVASVNILDKAHEMYPGKWILATEASYTKKLGESEVVHLGAWDRGEKYAEDIINVSANLH